VAESNLRDSSPGGTDRGQDRFAQAGWLVGPQLVDDHRFGVELGHDVATNPRSTVLLFEIWLRDEIDPRSSIHHSRSFLKRTTRAISW